MIILTGLAIDHYGRWLYWADAKRGEISAIRIDDSTGKTRHLVWNFKHMNGTFFTINYIYLTCTSMSTGFVVFKDNVKSLTEPPFQ